jgi:hypothetical protein
MSSESTTDASAAEMGMIPGTTRAGASPDDLADVPLLAKVAVGLAGCVIAPGA